MQENHTTAMHTKEHARDAATGQRASDLPQSAARGNGAADGHSHGPAVFNRGNIDTYDSAILNG
jgi:hypothetical protein